MMVMIHAVPYTVALLVGMILCLEIGRRLGIRKIGVDPTRLGTVEGAVFSLYGLLLAFTFSGAPARLDTRRQLIADEANAIRTAYLRVDLIPESAQSAMRVAFREYVDARIETYRKFPDFDAAKETLARSTKIQKDIWSQAVAATQMKSSQPDAVKGLLLSALNTMIDMSTTRTMATRIHPPPIIFGLLFLLALVCSLLAGYGMAANRSRSWVHIVSFVAITVISVYVILEIEYPRMNFIRRAPYETTYDDVLVELRESMN
jgi:hypothetical protein